MALNIIKHDGFLRWLTVCPLQSAKSLMTHKSPNRMHPDAKKQPVSLMERYAHISSMIIKFNIC